MRIITIVASRSLLGEYEIQLAGAGRTLYSTASDPGGAAAIALNYATSGDSSYVIVGAKEELEYSPQQIRQLT